MVPAELRSLGCHRAVRRAVWAPTRIGPNSGANKGERTSTLSCGTLGVLAADERLQLDAEREVGPLRVVDDG